MTISQVFKKVADKRLAEHGFKRRRLDGVIWVYERIHDGMKQSLCFQNHGGSLKNFDHHNIYDIPPQMYFTIGAHSDPNYDVFSGFQLTQLFPIDYIRAYSPRLANRLMEGAFYGKYRSFEELEEVISDYVDFTLDRAMHVFPALAKPYRWNSPEMIDKADRLEQKLSENSHQYADSFAMQYNLPYDIGISFIKEKITYVEKLLLENKNEDFDEMEELFLTSAGYLGELIIKTHGGKWGWKYIKGLEKSFFHVIDIPIEGTHIKQASSEKKTISTLAVVMEYWNNPEIYSNTIISHYKVLLHGIGLEDYYDS